MTKPIGTILTMRVPSPNTTAYKAGQYIYDRNLLSITEQDLFTAIYFGRYANTKQITLEAMIDNGWLERVKGGVALSVFARKFFDGLGKIEEPKLGSIATPRMQNVFERPPISRRYIPSSKGIRQDIPKFSERPEGFRFYTVA